MKPSHFKKEYSATNHAPKKVLPRNVLTGSAVGHVAAGGAVSAMVASERPADVAGLILLYPAFIIHDLAVKMFGSAENAPEVYHL